MFLLLFGSLIASDFQSINGDPCNQLTDGTIDWIQQKSIDLDTRLFYLSSDGSGTVKCTKWTTNNTEHNKISLNATLYCRDDCTAADRNTTCTLLQALSQADHYLPLRFYASPLYGTPTTHQQLHSVHHFTVIGHTLTPLYHSIQQVILNIPIMLILMLTN